MKPFRNEHPDKRSEEEWLKDFERIKEKIAIKKMASKIGTRIKWMPLNLN
jgi:hypothetical protein